MKLVILTRDGTINRRPASGFVTSPDEWQPLPGAPEAIAALNQAGVAVVVASNQEGLGRGLIDMTTLNAIHAKMHATLATVGARVEAIFFCPHGPAESCLCRKPLPGLLMQIADRYNADLGDIPIVGDALCDMQTAAAAGAMPHLLLTGSHATECRGKPMPEEFPAATRVHENLQAFSKWWLERLMGAGGQAS